MKPYTVVKDFEQALCEYTGAKYAVTTNSCTMALLLACSYFKYASLPIVDLDLNQVGIYYLNNVDSLEIPSKTYIGVAQSILNSGFNVKFREENWFGSYQLKPFPVVDSARRFTSDMYVKSRYQCVSFHASKILGDSQGGAILHDNDEADKWFRKARFDGRTEGVAPEDDNFIRGWHCYMSPDVAARLLLKLSILPKHNEDLPNDDYPDLSKQKIFQ